MTLWTVNNIWRYGATVEWYLEGEGEKPPYGGEILPQCHFVQQKSHVDWRGIEPVIPQSDAGDWKA